jgi:hypothetical protein
MDDLLDIVFTMDGGKRDDHSRLLCPCEYPVIQVTSNVWLVSVGERTVASDPVATEKRLHWLPVNGVGELPASHIVK